MNRAPRITIGAFAYLFAMNHMVLGLAWIYYSNTLTIAWLVFALYFVCVNLLILPFVGRHIPIWLAALTGAMAFSVNALALANLSPANIPASGSFATWFVGGVSTLFAIIAVRGHRTIALMGLATQVIQSLVWGGIEVATTMGLVGAIMLVVAASAISGGFETMKQSGLQFEARAQRSAAKSAEMTSGREAREQVLQSALDRTLPTLRKLVRDKGQLSAEAREDTKFLVQDLRDELLGRNLLSPAVRIAVKEARERGVTVVLSDEGGLDDYPAAEMPALHSAIARAIDEVVEGTVNVRSPKNEDYRVAITGQRPNAVGPDVWRRLP